MTQREQEQLEKLLAKRSAERRERDRQRRADDTVTHRLFGLTVTEVRDILAGDPRYEEAIRRRDERREAERQRRTERRETERQEAERQEGRSPEPERYF